MTIIKESEKMAMDNIEMLKSDDQKERLTAMYELLNFQPVWVTEAGLSNYTKDLFTHIENDITLDRNSSIYKSYQEIKMITENKDL